MGEGVLLLLQAIFQGVHPGMVARLDIRVRREHIMQDALNQLTGRGSELGKPLRVSRCEGPPGLLSAWCATIVQPPVLHPSRPQVHCSGTAYTVSWPTRRALW